LLPPACHCKAVLRILALQVPAVESGALVPPAHRGAGVCVWYKHKHLDGGFPVPGVRFGGLKSVRSGLHLLLLLFLLSPSPARRQAPTAKRPMASVPNTEYRHIRYYIAIAIAVGGGRRRRRSECQHRLTRDPHQVHKIHGPTTQRAAMTTE
jgi:hypothetical protein